MILYGDLSKEQRLAPEGEFAEQLGISRHHLREALRLLEQDGLVEIRRGHKGGVFLATPDSDVLARAFEAILARSATTVSDPMIAREVIEPAAARMAAANATDEELAGLEHIIVRQEESERYLPELNLEFHMAVARAAHNTNLLLAMSAMGRLVRALDASIEDVTSVIESTAAHRAILRSIRSHDADRAESVMRAHIVGFGNRLRETMFDPDTETVAGVLNRAEAAHVRRRSGGGMPARRPQQ